WCSRSPRTTTTRSRSTGGAASTSSTRPSSWPRRSPPRRSCSLPAGSSGRAATRSAPPPSRRGAGWLPARSRPSRRRLPPSARARGKRPSLQGSELLVVLARDQREAGVERVPVEAGEDGLHVLGLAGLVVEEVGVLPGVE